MLNLRPPSNKGFVTPPPRLPTPPPIIEGEYEIEAILTSRIIQNLRTGFRNRQFLIKWKGFTYQEMTWEDENNLSVILLYLLFYPKIIRIVKTLNKNGSISTLKGQLLSTKLGVQ